MQMTAMSNETQLAAFKQEGVNTCKKKKKKKKGGGGGGQTVHYMDSLKELINNIEA